MRIRLAQLTIDLDWTEEDLRQAVAKRLGIPQEAVLSCAVTRRSIDARRARGRVCFILSVEADIDDAAEATLLPALEASNDIEAVSGPEGSDEADRLKPAAGPLRLAPAHPPIVVGAGPAGLLAAWRLAEAGARPILIERGAPAEERKSSVARFWSGGSLDPEDNVLYGEGGAGLFSDGKLTTRTKLRGCLRTVLRLLVECGAPESILVDAEPHVGSDRLAEIVPRLRYRIRTLGGEVRFHARLEGLDVEGGRLVAVIINGQRIATRHCLLATGHSARDVYEMLYRSGIPLAAKPFAAGVRIEMPQRQIDLSQFGPQAGHPRLGAASFRLTRRGDRSQRACYTFCMCPGGSVIACASSPGLLTTNGMSLADRPGSYGNAAFLVPVGPQDFSDFSKSPDSEANPLAGVRWQEAIEARAFHAGGQDYSLPACGLEDFLSGQVSAALPEDRSCSRSVPADLHRLLPAFVGDALLHAIPLMMRKLRKVQPDSAIVYAAETRSSSPVRILRDERFQSPGAVGLFPAGEGAGYAGGIVTSAIDGLRAAESMLGTMA